MAPNAVGPHCVIWEADGVGELVGEPPLGFTNGVGDTAARGVNTADVDTTFMWEKTGVGEGVAARHAWRTAAATTANAVTDGDRGMRRG